jgi:hypothetical protein
MTISYNARVVTNGLVLNLDAANPRSLSGVNSNLITHPEDLSNAIWGKVSIDVKSSTTTAPNGSSTVYSVAEIVASAQHLLYYSIGTVAINDVFTFSGYFKNSVGVTQIVLHTNGEGTATFNISGAGSVAATSGANTLSSSITDAGNGWYRCAVTFRKANTVGTFYVSNQNGLGVYTGDGIKSYLAWGMQLERGSVLSNYYPVTGTSASITWQDLSTSGLTATLIGNPKYNSLYGGCLNFTGTETATITNPLIQANTLQEWTVCAWVNIDNTSSQNLLNFNNGLYPVYSASGSLLYLNGGVDDYYTYGGTFGLQGWSYATFRFKNSTGTRTIYKNGVSVTTSGPNSTSTPSGIPSTLTIGSNLRGSLSKLEIYNRLLSDEEVQQNFNALRGRYGV